MGAELAATASIPSRTASWKQRTELGRCVTLGTKAKKMAMPYDWRWRIATTRSTSSTWCSGTCLQGGHGALQETCTKSSGGGLAACLVRTHLTTIVISSSRRRIRDGVQLRIQNWRHFA